MRMFHRIDFGLDLSSYHAKRNRMDRTLIFSYHDRRARNNDAMMIENDNDAMTKERNQVNSLA